MPPAVVMTAVTVCYVHRRMALAFYNPDGDMPGLSNKPITTIRFAHTQPAPGEATSRTIIDNLSGVVDHSKRKIFEEKVEETSVNVV